MSVTQSQKKTKVNLFEKSEQLTLDDTKEPEGTEGTKIETNDPEDQDNKAN